ncbi:hypothetical protein B0H14DRAFT_3453735 [Mycena olivaceomarginata]|nr:hypothetical protein B0H14DRAFT_3453735 [Mycena olivaceomarginata]
MYSDVREALLFSTEVLDQPDEPDSDPISDAPNTHTVQPQKHAQDRDGTGFVFLLKYRTFELWTYDPDTSVSLQHAPRVRPPLAEDSQGHPHAQGAAALPDACVSIHGLGVQTARSAMVQFQELLCNEHTVTDFQQQVEDLVAVAAPFAVWISEGSHEYTDSI